MADDPLEYNGKYQGTKMKQNIQILIPITKFY